MRIIGHLGIATCLLLSGAPALAFRGVPACPPARYVVHDQPLVAGSTAPGVDVVDIAATQISTGSGCTPTVVRIRGTRKGTTVKGTFKTCRGITGKAKLTGVIDIACKVLTGNFVAKKSKVKRPFTATISTCGDQAWDAGREACDVGQGCDALHHCNDTCVCESLVPTTSTSIPHGTTTSTTAPRPDLTPTAASAPTTGDAGALVTVTWTVANQGQIAAPSPWNDTVYFSEDNIYSTNDRTLLTVQHQSALPAGQSYDKTDAMVTLPDLPAGNYFLIVRTDSSSQILETSETNNTYAMPIALRTPDLVVTALSGPQTALPSTQVKVSWTVSNPGTASCPASWNDTVYLSEDDILTSLDRVLLTIPHNVALDAGQSYDKTDQMVTIPGVPAGTYYLIVKTDNINQQFEENEANNTRATAIAIQTPDLVPTDLSGPPTAGAGTPVSVTWTVANQGTGAANGPWNDVLYLSEDNVIGAGDRNLGSFPRNVALNAGDSYDKQNQMVTIPAVPAGSYFLIVKTDNGSQQFEENETNNTRAVAITVQTPNLTPTTFSGPPTGAAGTQVAVTWTVENQGTGAANPSWTDNVYFSQDNLIGSGDLALGPFPHNVALAAADNYSKVDQLVTLPNVPTGDYFLIFRADNGGQVFESNDADNTRAFGITVQTPDLTPTALNPPASATKGQQVSVSWTVKNQGNAPARASWTDTVYFSQDDTIGTGDVLLKSLARNVALDPSQTYDVTGQAVTIPAAATPGSYFLIVRTDNGSQVFEESETNNTHATAITITP